MWFNPAALLDGSGDTVVLAERLVDDETNFALMLVGGNYNPVVNAIVDGMLVLKVEAPSPGASYAWTEAQSFDQSTLIHLAVLIDEDWPSSNRIFIQGVDSTASTNGEFGSKGFGMNAPLRLGGRDADPGQLSDPGFYTGVLDEVRLRASIPTAEAIALEVLSGQDLLLNYRTSEVLP